MDVDILASQVLIGRDLIGTVAIVTGANSGIGFETAKALAYHGATIVFACRDLNKAHLATDRLRKDRVGLRLISFFVLLAQPFLLHVVTAIDFFVSRRLSLTATCKPATV